MDAGIIIALTGTGCTVISSLITFFLTKRKYNVDVDSQQIKNMGAAFDAYKKMTDDTIKILNEKIDTLQRENESLKSQLSLIQTQMVNMLIGEKMGVFEKDKKKK